MIYRIWVLFIVINVLLLASQVLKIKRMLQEQFPDVDFNQLENESLDKTLNALAQALLVIICPLIHIVFAFYLAIEYDNLVQDSYKKVYPKILNKINKIQGMYNPDDETRTDS